MADSAAAPPKPSSSVKLVLLGEAAVGKVSMSLSFISLINNSSDSHATSACA